MTDVLGPLLRGEITLLQADEGWIVSMLQRDYPAVAQAIRHVDEYRDGIVWYNIAWYALEPELAKAGVAGDELRDWDVASGIATALSHPQEKLAESIQFVRGAILDLHEWALAHRGTEESERSRTIAEAIAYAFSTQPDDDDEHDIRKSAASWFDRLTAERSIPGPGPST